MAGTTTTSKDILGRNGMLRRMAVAVNKLVDDAETIRGASSDSVVAVTELITDHATFITAATAANTLLSELQTLLNQVRNRSRYQALANPAFAIKTNFDVQNANAVYYTNAGTLKTLAAAQTFDTGTAATIATTKFGAALLTINASGNPVVTWAAGSPATYATEAAAIAALALPDATSTVLGYVTVQAAGSTWTAGTDALTTGTGGTPATATTYYNDINPNSLVFGAASASATSAPPATLSASAPSGTAIDAASDLTAAKIGDMSGTALSA